MRQHAVVFLVILIGLSGFTVYCAALIDWVQDYQTGIYAHNLLEAIMETMAIIVYTFLAVRFAREKVNLY